jgi:hypothetical protein
MILDYLGGLSVITRGLGEKQEGESQRQRYDDRSRGWSDVSMSHGLQVASQSWKTQGNGFYP